MGWVWKSQSGPKIEIVKGSILRELEPFLSSKFEAGIVTHDVARCLSPGRLGAVLARKAKVQGADIVKDEILEINRTGENWCLKGKECQYTSQSLVIAAGAWSWELLSIIGVSGWLFVGLLWKDRALIILNAVGLAFLIKNLITAIFS